MKIRSVYAARVRCAVQLRIVVSTRVLAPYVHRPLDLPAHALAGVIGTWPSPALLESGPGFGEAGRWSIFAAHPRLVWEATDTRWSLRTDTGTLERGTGQVFEVLAGLLRRFALADPTEAPVRGATPFQGGMIGYFGYDLAPKLERLPRRAPRDSRLPDIRLALYDTAVIVDSDLGRAELWAWDMTEEGRGAVCRRSDRWQRALERALRSPRSQSASRRTPVHPTSAFDRSTYLETVQRVLDYIAAGDVFQVNLSQRFTAHGDQRPLELYQALKTASPAPFAAFLQWDELAIVSASPESFYQTRGATIVTRPIKGTRPRGADPAEDRRLAAELRASAKDRAELAMIVDLEAQRPRPRLRIRVSGRA